MENTLVAVHHARGGEGEDNNKGVLMSEIWKKAWLPQFGRLFNRL